MSKGKSTIEETKSKQKTIKAIPDKNSELLKLNHYFDQNRMEKKYQKLQRKNK